MSSFPLPELKELSDLVGDAQVFSLQQRLMGESMIVHDDVGLRCMRFSEFSEKWSEGEFSRQFDPLTRFLDKLKPENQHRWKRLTLMAEALKQLREECERLLMAEPL